VNVTDAGRQVERTILAHWRTQLATLAVAVLIVRQAEGGLERAVAATLVVVLVAATAGIGLHRRRRLVAGATGPAPRVTGAILLVVVALQLVALVLVL
jgi:hypothetical protein